VPDSFTANYNFVKPEVNSSRDTWGGKWNGNADSIDTLIAALNTSKVDKTGGVLTGLPTFEGSPLATQKFVTDALKALIPDGMIAMWSGAVAAIPAGWQLCDGTNGTINLRDKFVVGAGLTYAPAAVGGALTHNHGGTSGLTALTLAQIPSHAHPNEIVQNPHSHTVSDPGHNHTETVPASAYSVPAGGAYVVGGAGTGTPTGWSYTNISVAAANAIVNISNGFAGGSGSHNHPISSASSLPPYYALAFIQKIWPAP